MLLGARDAGAEAQYGGEADQSCPHDGARKLVPGVRSVTGRENAIKFVNRRLIVRSARLSNFSRVSRHLKRALDGAHVTNHCAAVNGLNHISGICPEIIR
jgi:hypothetical protein